MKNMKRIHSITIKRMVDENPDTSYLGEYSNRAESGYAIDRKHSLDCPQQSFNTPTEVLDLLERIMAHIRNVKDAHCSTVKNRTDAERESDMDIWTNYDDAEDVCIDAGERVQECDCGERGDMERNEYRYFNPYQSWAKDDTEQDKRECAISQYERMESLNRGNWHYIGIRAEAEILIPSQLLTPNVNNDPNYVPTPISSTIQHITSGGLWGIESDSDASYLAEIEQEQLAELREQLHAIGFSKRAISAAFRDIQHQS